MKSLAIWYEPKSGSEPESAPELHLHFNHWKLKNHGSTSKLKYDYLLDIGIRVINGECVEKICLFLPQVITSIENVIEDLGETLTDKRILTAVFNEKYDPRPLDGQKYFEVKEKEKTLFHIYKLDVNQDISAKVDYEGTIIRFTSHSYKKLDTYYRIRLKTDFVKQFSYNYKPKSTYLESIFSSIELIDFRINDTRNLNLSLLEQISNYGKRFNISLIHLFVMRNLNDEYILSDQLLNNVRQLEEETWGTYLGVSRGETKYIYEKVIAYHLKTKAVKPDKKSVKYIEDFSALLKFRFEDRQLKRYFFYLILFSIGIAIVGNTLYELIKGGIFTIYHLWPSLEILNKPG